jgi:ubiquitin-conjugating enzyme E2 Q
MSFKKFKADVSSAAQKAASGGIAGVRSVTNGDSDGEVVIKYHHENLPGDVRIQALAQSVGDYPDGNMFMLWTDDPDPPPIVVTAVKTAQDYLIGMSVYEMVTELASRLDKEICRALDGGIDSADDADEEDEADDYDAAYDPEYSSDGDEFGLPSLGPRPSHQKLRPTDDQKPVLRRIRRDLRQVKQAGYKVGFLDGLGKYSTTGIVAVSIRVDKLALSEEAMEAWDVKPTEYIVLLLRFEKRYDPLERIIEQAASHTEVTFRIGKCNKYKPSFSQALRAFAETNRSLATDEDSKTGAEGMAGDANFEKLLVSNSLDSFLCESFVSLLKLRQAHGLGWEKANECLLSRMGILDEEYRAPEPSPGPDLDNTDQASEHHHVLGSDHLREKGHANERSFPLIAMQFAMRYFVKCTEYCLRCHRRLESGFEALRPYVCSDPLCLFQYMAMGFGPSIEHEILTEPYVVDLLVSLCYSAIQPSAARRQFSVPPGTTPEHNLPIRSLPVGLRLRVPDLSNPTASPLKARVAADNKHLVFEDEGAEDFGEKLAPGRWLALRKPVQVLTQHARVLEVNHATKTAFIEVIGESSAYWHSDPENVYLQPSLPADGVPKKQDPDIVDVYLYDTDFDSLDDRKKGAAMRHILDTLPSILEIEEWLASHPHSTLRSMERISPAAASLLQWIVSSNRSCIFQVDRSRAIAQPRKGTSKTREAPKAGATDSWEASGVAGRGRNREHERILGMDGWVQFRFAQGSPDKELRFKRALQEVAARKPIHNNPTIFAWHGSSLANWHSIVRTGLDFQDISSGRAYGDGVYFSPHYVTSISYAGGGQSWPNSDLNITGCLSLNEIINVPEDFVSRTPHYVVSQTDWHQCRYLFVQTAAGRGQTVTLADRSATKKAQSQPKQEESDPNFYPQAKGREVHDQMGQVLQIPLSAIPLRTVGPTPATPSGAAKRSVELLEDSDDEDVDDVSRLFSDDEFDAPCSPPNKKPASRANSMDIGASRDMYVNHPNLAPREQLTNLYSGGGPPTPASISVGRALTDFEPGTLDLSTLPRLQPPSFATDAATKSLSRELKRLQALQSSTPLHELGWYMDFDSVSNLFQWIVQLHSFDPSLPLSKDMKQAGVTSIVLELRFGPDYPYSPPFVRVVRPRFLPFVQGGGGHVTAGGAMCMELLTSSGWSPANSMESVFLQVRMALCTLEPRPGRLDPKFLKKNKDESSVTGGDYGVGEAIDAFVRAANSHGWTVPEGLRTTAMGV